MPSLLKTIKNALCRLLQARWAVAFWVDGRLMVVGNPYRDRWFADPFIVDADDKTPGAIRSRCRKISFRDARCRGRC